MTTNYGQARFSIGSQMAGSVRLASVTHAPALAPRLRFNLAWTLGHLQSYPNKEQAPTEYRVTSIDGELRLGEHGPAVGLLFQLGERHHLRSFGYVDEQTTDLVLDLDWFRFERLEELRQGGALEAWLKLWPRAEATAQTLDARVECFRVRIPREDWLALLGSLTGDRTDLLEIRYHLSYAGAFRPSLEELRDARSDVERGECTGAVVRCRKAILLLEDGARASTGKALLAVLKGVVDERHAKIYDGIASRLKEMGNIQVHARTTRAYSRAEALFAVRSVELLLELVGSLLARRSQTPPAT